MSHNLGGNQTCQQESVETPIAVLNLGLKLPESRDLVFVKYPDWTLQTIPLTIVKVKTRPPRYQSCPASKNSPRLHLNVASQTIKRSGNGVDRSWMER